MPVFAHINNFHPLEETQLQEAENLFYFCINHVDQSS